MVKDLSFHLKKGEVLFLVGESGSGKSITALSILGLVPNPGMVERGEVIYRGKDLLSLPDEEMRKVRGRRISMVFQDPNTSLNPVLSVERQLGEVLEVHFGEVKREKLASILKEVGFKEPNRVLSSYPHELSGGMKQRVAIAMALLGEPEVLIADEPTTALDVSTQSQIISLLEREKENRSLSVLFITHDFGIVAELADRVCVMLDGYLVEEGSVLEVFDNPLHPYTEHLIASMPGSGRKVKRIRRLESSKGCPFYNRCPYSMAVCREKVPGLYSLNGRRARCWKLL